MNSRARLLLQRAELAPVRELPLALPHPHSALVRLVAPSPCMERGQAEHGEAGGEVNPLDCPPGLPATAQDSRWPRWLMALLVVWAALAVVYSVASPIFEPPDEVFHFPVIDHIARTGSLPVQDPQVETRWHQEGSQPPLYYLLSAPLIWPIDRSDLAARQERNPHARIGIGLATDNQAIVLHDWDAESFPWRGTALAVHLVRFFSILLGLGTVICIYHLARLAAPGRPVVHLTATALAAFNPMFLFISASVNNDNLINLLSAATLALLLYLWHAGLTARRIGELSLLLALASLSKLSGLALYPLAALVILLIHARDRLGWRSLWRAGAIVIGVWLVVAGWWYWRNLRLYGEPTGMNRMIAIIGPREQTPSLADLLDEFQGLRLSFWGVFGMFNVIAPDALFDYAEALTLLAALGWALAGVMALARRRSINIRLRRTDWPTCLAQHRAALPVALLSLHALIVAAALLNWTRRTPATQGRLLFPALGPLAILAALGLAQLFPRRWQRALPLATLPLLAFAVWLPWGTIRPAYTPPPVVAALPEDTLPVNARFGPIELLGVRVSDAPVTPGDERGGLRLTLYWRPQAHTAQDMSLYVQVFGLPRTDVPDELQEIAKLDSYPGGGLLRTSTWRLGVIYADEYTLPIVPAARTPVRPLLKIGWRQFETGEEFAPTAPDGTPREPVMIAAGRVIGQSRRLAVGEPVEAVFTAMLRLNRADVSPVTAAPGDAITVALEWEALARVREDFTILVHLIDSVAPDRPLAQGDSPALEGRWPTSAWEPHRAFVDEHIITLPPDLPPGAYHVAVGFYRPADFTRLPVETKHATLPGAVVLPQTLVVEDR